jgi:hypothetical protein
MNDRDTRRYEMFNRVRAFGLEHAADFAPNSKAAGHFTALGTILQALDQARAVQRGDGSTASKAVLIDALRLDIANIHRTARAIAQTEPGFASGFSRPEQRTQSEILAAADAMILRLHAQPGDPAEVTAAKTALVAKFVDYELPADFVAQLVADRAAVAAAQDDQDASRNATVAGTATLSLQIEHGLRQVASLDAIMHNKYTREPEKLRAWRSASHTERSPHHSKPVPQHAPAPA